jgi:TatD DNase family protein
MLIDVHAHLNQDPLYTNWKEILRRAREKRVEKIIVIGYDFESSKIAVDLSKIEKDIYSTIGIHPHDADSLDYDNLPWEKLISSKMIAIGEIGLDYFKMYSSRERQKEIFRKGINFAKRFKLPIIIHCRNAFEDLIKILKEERAWEIKGIIHSYSGSYEISKILADYGFLFSFSGPITYPNSNRLREVVSKIPLDLILIETDSPYLAPQLYRGKINEPSYLPEIAKKLSEIKNIPLDNLEEILKENIKKIFPNIFNK